MPYQHSNHRQPPHRNNLKFVLLICLITVIVVVLVIFCVKMLPSPSSPGTSHAESQSELLSSTPSTLESEPSSQPVSSENTTDSSVPSTAGTPSENYDYSQPVPQSGAVDIRYFDDAVFLGDSRTEDFILYTGLDNADSITHIGMAVDTVFSDANIQRNGTTMTAIDALKQDPSFSKVYIMLGVNELGWYVTDIFIEYYEKIIDTIREINPDAKIYIQGIIPVSAEKSASDKIYNNDRIERFNSLIRDMAKRKEVYFVNVAESVVDSTGCIPADAAPDGVHLNKEYCLKWLEYLKTHTVR